MKYSEEQIREFANGRMERLMKNEYKVETLPNNADLYYSDKEIRDAKAIRETNSNSRLFQAVFED